jgi:hypothetical protein
MGKNKSTRSDGVTSVNKTQELESTERRMPKGANRKNTQSPK